MTGLQEIGLKLFKEFQTDERFRARKKPSQKYRINNIFLIFLLANVNLNIIYISLSRQFNYYYVN